MVYEVKSGYIFGGLEELGEIPLIPPIYAYGLYI